MKDKLAKKTNDILADPSPFRLLIFFDTQICKNILNKKRIQVKFIYI